jgi:hypothetical protein
VTSVEFEKELNKVSRFYLTRTLLSQQSFSKVTIMSDHHDAQDYTANGPTDIGFRTGGDNTGITNGVVAYGTEFGVRGIGVGTEGSSKPAFGVFGEGKGSNEGVVGQSETGTGVRGESRGPAPGVQGDGNPGVKGHSDEGVGVQGDSNISVGVEGEGDPGVRGFSQKGVAGVVGEALVGSGVVGYGGRADWIRENVGMEDEDQRGTGVYGAGQNGVKGVGLKGRGGVFVSKSSAQVRLVPTERDRGFKEEAFTPNALINPSPVLPRMGQSGDLLTLTDDRKQCTVWLCVQGNIDSSKATWAQLLVGPAYEGET